MQVFRIKISSLFIYALSSLLVIFSGMAIGVYMALTHVKDVYFFVLILFGLTALVFVPELLSTATVEWSITEQEIRIKWLSQFLFQKKPDLNFTWEDIQEYKYQPERKFNLLEIKLRDHRIIKCRYNNDALFNESDDFNKLVSYFEKKVDDFNDRGINFLHNIKRRQTIYETTWGKILSVIMVMLMITFPITVALKGPQHVDWAYTAPAYGSCIYFVSKVISYRRKKRRLA